MKVYYAIITAAVLKSQVGIKYCINLQAKIGKNPRLEYVVWDCLFGSEWLELYVLFQRAPLIKKTTIVTEKISIAILQYFVWLKIFNLLFYYSN